MRKWLDRVINGVLVLIIVVALFIVFAPRFYYFKVAVVMSGSMAPAIPTGSLAFTGAIATEDIKVGDVIAFNADEKATDSTSHRVMEIINDNGLFFRTRGDANESDDPEFVPANKVRGRILFSIPRLGRLFLSAVGYIKSQFGMIIFIVIPSLLTVGGTLWEFRQTSGLRQRRALLLEKRRKSLHI
jgi:signal peptidase